MSDPNRLLDDPNLGGFGRALLDAAGNDGPDAAGRQRVAKRLGIAAGLASSAVAGGSAVATVLTATAIVIGLGAVLGMAVSRSTTRAPAVATVTVEKPRSSPPVTPAPAMIAPSVPPSTVAAVPTTSPVTTRPAPAIAARRATIVPPATITPSPTVVAPVTAPTVDPPPSSTSLAPPPTTAPPPITAQAPALPAASPSPPVPVDARRLAAEVASLDRAREQLRRRDAGAALALLDAHDREFGSGVLIAEASVVRVEALILQGRRDDARRLADSFLVRFPRSPLVQRVRSLRDSLVR